jgi:nucleotide-binding universal stress UspA family protein
MQVEQRPVVVATDGEERSAGALRYGAHEARRRGVPLRVVHVVATRAVADPVLGYSPELGQALEDHGRTVLAEAERAVRSMTPAVEVEKVLASGGRIGEIVEAARSAQMVVLGRETRTGLQRLWTGATTAAVAGRSPVPAVVVPGDWQIVEHGRMVVGVESEECARPLLHRAFERAAERGAELVVVHAWDLPVPSGDLMGTERYVREWRAAGAHLLSQLLTGERRAYPGLGVEATVVHAQAAHALVAAAAACDLLVLGRRSRSAVGWTHLGATARAVLREARVPVEVVPLGEGAHR